MRGSNFIINCVDLLHYECHEINLNRGGTYINFPFRIKNKKTTIYPIKIPDNKCFQYAGALALYHKELG